MSRVKRQRAGWETAFANYPSHKGLINTKLRNPTKLKRQKIKNPIPNWVMDQNGRCSKQGVHMANRYTTADTLSSTSHQGHTAKPARTWCFPVARTAPITKHEVTHRWNMWKERPLLAAGGKEQAGSLKIELPSHPAILSLGVHPQGMKSTCWKAIHMLCLRSRQDIGQSWWRVQKEEVTRSAVHDVTCCIQWNLLKILKFKTWTSS